MQAELFNLCVFVLRITSGSSVNSQWCMLLTVLRRPSLFYSYLLQGVPGWVLRCSLFSFFFFFFFCCCCFFFQFCFTHICQVDPSTLIKWTSPFPILGVSGVRFHFYYIANRFSFSQTVNTLIRRRVLRLRRLFWVCTVCLCPKNGTLGLYGLTL